MNYHLHQSLPVTAVFEWRSEYKANLVETQDGKVEVIDRQHQRGNHHHHCQPHNIKLFALTELCPRPNTILESDK